MTSRSFKKGALNGNRPTYRSCDANDLLRRNRFLPARRLALRLSPSRLSVTSRCSIEKDGRIELGSGKEAFFTLSYNVL